MLRVLLLAVTMMTASAFVSQVGCGCSMLWWPVESALCLVLSLFGVSRA